MRQFKMIATSLLGIEGIVADDLRRMGAENVQAQNGRVSFEGGFDTLIRANLRSCCSERILIEMGEFKAFTFDELFEKTKVLPWENWIGKKDAFPVSGRSLSSKLFSVPDCQSIIKRAVVERLKSVYSIPWFEETGAKYQIRFLIMKDTVTLMIDSSGEGLHKRGYRNKSALDAPIKETLAAAICDIVRVRPESTVYDPFCGSGTLLIESAFRAMRIAPGLLRKFACENWDIPKSVFREERELTQGLIRNECGFRAIGSDIDEEAVRLTVLNARKAIVSNRITASAKSIKDFQPEGDMGVVICNPPYGERLLDISEARKLYRILGDKCEKKKGWSYAVISSDEEFETHFGRKADKRRKLYNGMIQCQLYMFFKG